EQLDRYGHRDVVRGLAELAEAGTIELTGSAMFHPILPLLPRREMRRQIQLNEHACRRYLGEAFRPQGVFPPEMCYSRDVALIVRDLGYRWILVDEVARGTDLGSSSASLERRCYALEGLGEFYAFLKERPLSAKLTYGDLPDARALLSALGP